MPSREAVHRASKALDPFTVIVARQGLETARTNHMPVGPELQLTRLDECKEMDEHAIDILSLLHSSQLWSVMTRKDRLGVGLDDTKARWVLTFANCATARCIQGMVISRYAKATAAVQFLQIAVCGKGQWFDAVRARPLGPAAYPRVDPGR